MENSIYNGVNVSSLNQYISIPQFYDNKTVFITGGTGFLGKVSFTTNKKKYKNKYIQQVLVEKLLRSCPKIGTIYVLLRPKNKMSPSDRLQKIKNTAKVYTVENME